MTSAIALARAELLILSRDRVAAFNAVVIPLAAAIYLIVNPPAIDQVPGPLAASLAAAVLAILASAALAFPAVTTIVHRREQHLLERWRISGTAPAAILTGTIAPVLLLLVGGTTFVFTALGITLNHAPAHPVWLVIAVVLAAALGTAAAALGAGFARTSEAAGVVVVPIAGALLGGGLWATFVPLGEITWQMRATGGGALTELVRIGWQGPTDGAGLSATLSAGGPSVLLLVGLTTGLALAATRTFRWHARG